MVFSHRAGSMRAESAVIAHIQNDGAVFFFYSFFSLLSPELRERESKREREREFELSNFNTRIVALEQPDFVRDKIR